MATHSSILAWRIPLDRSYWSFPNGSAVKKKKYACNAGDAEDMGSILGWEDHLKKGNPLQYSYLVNPLD